MMYKLWNKETCYEIYFRPLPDTDKVEVITYLNGDPFVNPRSLRQDNNGNTEVWDIQDARDNWSAWTIHGGYEVAEVEDYLKRVINRGKSMNYRKNKKIAE